MTESPGNFARTLFWVFAGTLVLMVPALIVGRPFIFWDTPTFYSWGHDVIAAIREPWPDLSQFPAHRGLWAADYAPGSWDRITPEQFQLTLTAIGARSPFYAVLLYGLGSWATLWAPAVVQALAASSLLWITASILLGRRSPVVFLFMVVGLTLGTSLPFHATFLMPDIFAGLGLLSAALLLCFPDRMSALQRTYAALLIVIAIVVHTSNLAVLIALVLIAIAASWSFGYSKLKLEGFTLVGSAVVVALGAQALSQTELQSIFGQPVRTAPFLEGRVIADGPGQIFLRETCEVRHFAACIYKDENVIIPDDIIWPDYSTHGLPLINEPGERRRFLDEQTDIVMGTIKSHPVAELVAAFKNGLRGAADFRIANSMGASLRGLLEEDNDQRIRVLQIVPNLQSCLISKPEPCDLEPQLRPVQWLHYIVATAAFIGLALRVLQHLRARRDERDAEHGHRMLFATIVMATVLANGAICGAAAGPWERYQARVIWLVPMAFGLVEVSRALVRHRRKGSNALPSRPSTAVG